MTAELGLLCLKVFFCRILDVSIGTTRTIQIVKGNRLLAAALGFAEIFIWFTVVREALRSDMGGIPIAVAYAAGYATGTFIGCLLSERFINRKMSLMVVTGGRDPALLHAIREAGYALSAVDVLPSEFSGGRYLLLIEVDSRNLKALRALITRLDEKAFITVNESKSVYNGYFAP